MYAGILNYCLWLLLQVRIFIMNLRVVVNRFGSDNLFWRILDQGLENLKKKKVTATPKESFEKIVLQKYMFNYAFVAQL